MDLFNIRKNYTQNQLDKSDLLSNPLVQVERWLAEAEAAKCLEHSAIALSTVSKDGQPSTRMVLLKHIDSLGFYFFTNYNSRKGQQLEATPKASILLFWPELERQIHIEGHVEKCNPELSDKYFQSRPVNSQISAIISQQSQTIENKSAMLALREPVENESKKGNLERPNYWGGYILRPNRVEFWQGGANRFHDRIEYLLRKEEWVTQRLMP